MIHTMAGFRVATDARKIIDTKEPRVEARYRRAMEVLQDKKLLAPLGHRRDLFRITDDGYLRADELLALRAQQ